MDPILQANQLSLLQDRKVRIELASFIPLSVNVIGEQLTHISNELDRISGGNVTFEIFEPNALVGPLEILDAVSDGKVDAGYGAAAFWAGKIPSAPLFSQFHSAQTRPNSFPGCMKAME